MPPGHGRASRRLMNGRESGYGVEDKWLRLLGWEEPEFASLNRPFEPSGGGELSQGAKAFATATAL